MIDANVKIEIHVPTERQTWHKITKPFLYVLFLRVLHIAFFRANNLYMKRPEGSSIRWTSRAGWVLRANNSVRIFPQAILSSSSLSTAISVYYCYFSGRHYWANLSGAPRGAAHLPLATVVVIMSFGRPTSLARAILKRGIHANISISSNLYSAWFIAANNLVWLNNILEKTQTHP